MSKTLGFNAFELYLFISVLIGWILSEHIGANIIPYLRRHGAKIRKKERGSYLLVGVNMYATIIVAFVFAIRGIALLPVWTLYPGILLVILGTMVRQWAIAVLGRFFSTTVGVQEGQKVVKTGPYRLIRHPSYAGMFMILLGIGMMLHSWGAILLQIIFICVGFGYRIHAEEKLLVKELGEEYIQYMKKTKKVIPYLL